MTGEAIGAETQPNRRLWHELSLSRVFVVLLLAALPPTAVLVALGIIAGADLTSDEDLVALILAYPAALLWLGLCAGVHLGLIRILGTVTRRQCLVWGVVSGLLPGAAWMAVDYATSLEVERDTWVGALMFTAALALLAGPFSGWIAWRLGMRPSPGSDGMRLSAGAIARQHEAERRVPLTPQHRRWRDLHSGRVWLGLSLAPIVVTALLAFALMFDEDMTTPGAMAADIVTLVATMICWFIGGWAYLQTVARRRRRIARIECLLLGIVLTDLMPLLLMLFVFAFGDQQALTEMFGGRELSLGYKVAVVVVAEMLFAPLGLLNGWLFWRFGVRPGPLPQPDVTGVFD